MTSLKEVIMAGLEDLVSISFSFSHVPFSVFLTVSNSDKSYQCTCLMLCKNLAVYHFTFWRYEGQNILHIQYSRTDQLSKITLVESEKYAPHQWQSNSRLKTGRY